MRVLSPRLLFVVCPGSLSHRAWVHDAGLLMAVVPTPGRLLRPADIHVPNADSSAVALESSSVESRASKFRIRTGPQKASRSTTRATRGRELPKSTVGFLLPGPQAVVPSTVPFAPVRRCAPHRRRPENQSRSCNRLFPPCNTVEFSAIFHPLTGEAIGTGPETDGRAALVNRFPLANSTEHEM